MTLAKLLSIQCALPSPRFHPETVQVSTRTQQRESFFCQQALIGDSMLFASSWEETQEASGWVTSNWLTTRTHLLCAPLRSTCMLHVIRKSLSLGWEGHIAVAPFISLTTRTDLVGLTGLIGVPFLPCCASLWKLFAQLVKEDDFSLNRGPVFGQGHTGNYHLC